MHTSHSRHVAHAHTRGSSEALQHTTRLGRLHIRRVHLRWVSQWARRLLVVVAGACIEPGVL
jgi:hypothetical protein